MREALQNIIIIMIPVLIIAYETFRICTAKKDAIAYYESDQDDQEGLGAIALGFIQMIAFAIIMFYSQYWYIFAGLLTSEILNFSMNYKSAREVELTQIMTSLTKIIVCAVWLFLLIY